MSDQAPPAVLYINPGDSKCGVCDRGADPKELNHHTELGYYSGPRRAGCQAIWTHLSTRYMGVATAVAKSMRPDLEWIGPE
jgi:hypothetical protein